MSVDVTTGYRDRPFAFFWDAVGICAQNYRWGNHPAVVMHDWTFSFMALMHHNVWEMFE